MPPMFKESKKVDLILLEDENLDKMKKRLPFLKEKRIDKLEIVIKYNLHVQSVYRDYRNIDLYEVNEKLDFSDCSRVINCINEVFKMTPEKFAINVKTKQSKSFYGLDSKTIINEDYEKYLKKHKRKK